MLLLIFSIIIGFYYLRVIRFLFFAFFLFENKLINFYNLTNNIIILFFFNLYFLIFFDFISENLMFILLTFYINY
jgi:hypothetical protein